MNDPKLKAVTSPRFNLGVALVLQIAALVLVVSTTASLRSIPSAAQWDNTYFTLQILLVAGLAVFLTMVIYSGFLLFRLAIPCSSKPMKLHALGMFLTSILVLYIIVQKYTPWDFVVPFYPLYTILPTFFFWFVTKKNEQSNKKDESLP